MKTYRYNNYIKIVFLFCAIFLAGTFFYINRVITQELKKTDSNKQLTIAKSWLENFNSEEYNPDVATNISKLVDNLNLSIIIKTTSSDSNTPICQKITLKNPNYETPKCSDEIYEIIKSMESFEIEDIENGIIYSIYYGDTSLANKIQWVPYIQLGFAVIVTLIVLLGMNIMNTSESNMIYVGMSKETAHQLGTPISSLMGWFDLLKTKIKKDDYIFKAIDEDIEQLKNISDKFNKIGSETKLKKISLNKVFNNLIIYFDKRIPESKNIELSINTNKEYFIEGDYILIYWAFENLIKNAIESITTAEGKIEIKIFTINNTIKIQIIDNGKTISRTQKNKIFKPGFSTKNKGWGLGLNLSKRIINQIHKGAINLILSNDEQTIFQIEFKSFYSS